MGVIFMGKNVNKKEQIQYRHDLHKEITRLKRIVYVTAALSTLQFIYLMVVMYGR